MKSYEERYELKRALSMFIISSPEKPPEKKSTKIQHYLMLHLD